MVDAVTSRAVPACSQRFPKRAFCLLWAVEPKLAITAFCCQPHVVELIHPRRLIGGAAGQRGLSCRKCNQTAPLVLHLGQGDGLPTA